MFRHCIFPTNILFCQVILLIFMNFMFLILLNSGSLFGGSLGLGCSVVVCLVIAFFGSGAFIAGSLV